MKKELAFGMMRLPQKDGEIDLPQVCRMADAYLLSGESCSVQQILQCSVPLWFCGGIAIGFACTVQVAAQKVVHPATASIILSMASVFAVLWGWLLRDEVYTPANLIGCAIIFSAVVMVELPERITKN